MQRKHLSIRCLAPFIRDDTWQLLQVTAPVCIQGTLDHHDLTFLLTVEADVQTSYNDEHLSPDLPADFRQQMTHRSLYTGVTGQEQLLRSERASPRHTHHSMGGGAA